MMARLLRIGFFLILLTNSLTLGGGPLPFDVYTLDLALIPFALLVAVKFFFLPRPRLRITPFDLLFVLLIALIAVSFLFSLNRELSLTNAMDWLRLVLIYFLARSVLGSVIQERALVIQFTIMALFLVGLGFLQIAAGEPLGIIADYFGESREQYGWYRVSGPTPNSNVFAMWVIVYGGLSLSVFLAKIRPFLFFAMASAMTVVLIGTLYRGGALGFVVLVFVLLLMHSQTILSMRFLIPASLLTVGLVGLLFIMVVANVQPVLTRGVLNLVSRQEEARDFEEGAKRRDLLQLGLQLLRRPKIAAVGSGAGGMLQASLVGSSATAAISQRLVDGGVDVGTGVHNVWIATAVENGIPSAAILFLIFVFFIRQITRWRRRHEESRIWAAYLMAIGIWYLVVASQVYLEAARLPVLLPVVVLIAFAANWNSDTASSQRASNRVHS
jgi:O-antigen ligase